MYGTVQWQLKSRLLEHMIDKENNHLFVDFVEHERRDSGACSLVQKYKK